MRREVQEMTDRILTCKICGNTFIFTTGEQTFYRDRCLAEPRMCPACRRVKREEPRSEHTKD